MPQANTPPTMRPGIPESQINLAFDTVSSQMKRALQENGNGSWVSRHEILGEMTEEYVELTESVRLKDATKMREFKQELIDIAVTAIFGIACIDNGWIDENT